MQYLFNKYHIWWWQEYFLSFEWRLLRLPWLMACTSFSSCCNFVFFSFLLVQLFVFFKSFLAILVLQSLFDSLLSKLRHSDLLSKLKCKVFIKSVFVQYLRCRSQWSEHLLVWHYIIYSHGFSENICLVQKPEDFLFFDF